MATCEQASRVVRGGNGVICAAIAIALGLTAPATMAYGRQQAPAAAPDPARQAAARRVVEQFLPPASRDKMVETMMAGMHANIRQSMLESPDMTSLFAKLPEAKAQIAGFLDEEQARSLELMRQSMPMLVDAMTNAYARRFTVAQLGEIEAFFATPTGKLYVSESMGLMSDPDVQAAQRTMMTRSLEGMQERIQKLTDEMMTKSGGGNSE